MRFLVTLVLSGSLIVGCDEDGSENPRSDCLTTGAEDGGVTPSSPVITNIDWNPLGYCRQGARTSYNLLVFADDPDSDDLELIFDVNVPDCSLVAQRGNIFVFSCPNNAPQSGIACAEDPEGNTSSRAAFTFQVCQPGSCRQTPDACDMLTLDP